MLNTGEPLVVALADMLELNPGMARTLMRDHVDNGRGACVTCSTQMARVAWPCTLCRLTALATAMHT